MNSYKMNEINSGMVETFTVKITEKMMSNFLEITGDKSPIHIDETYAKSKGFTGKVCYGLLATSFFSTLSGVYLPGEHCLLHSVDSKFLKPVYLDDVLTITGVVQEVNAVFLEITIKAVITNQNGIKVAKGLIKAGLTA